MRYKELYEMIDMAMVKTRPSFPISDNLKQFFIDQAVDKIGETVVLKKRTFDLGTVSKRRTVIPSLDVTNKVYKVEVGDKNLPFINEEITNPNVTDADVYQNAYYLKQGTAQHNVTGVSITNVSQSVCTFTITGNTGDSTQSGSIVRLDKVPGAKKDGFKHPFNGREFETTTYDSGSLIFTADGNYSTTAGYSAFGTGAIATDVGYYINFLKIPEGNVKIYYYARPRRFSSIEDFIDLPSELVSAVSHMVIARILSTDNQMQLGSGHRGIATKIIEDWIQSRSRREQYPDIIPQPLTEFINK